MLTRRQMFYAPAAAAVLTLPACAQIEGRQKLARVATDVALIADALATILPQLAKVQGVDAEKIAEVGIYVAELKVLAERIKIANDTPQAQDIVLNVTRNLQAVLASLSVIPVIPPQIQTILTAAQVLLPVIQAAVNIILPRDPSAPTRLDMTVEEARRKLAGN